MSQITEITGAHQKLFQLMLNHSGTFTNWMHLEDSNTQYIEEHKTCYVVYRNSVPIWSAPIYQCIENADNNLNATLNITAMGWFELLNKRIVHTGYEWKEMAIKASGRTIISRPIAEHEKESEEIETLYNDVISEGFYVPIATESAQQLFYANIPMAEIANDLIIRANIDVPTGITIGLVAPTNSINLTIQQFSNVGEQITKLTSIESGFDFDIDPLTKKFNTYRDIVRAGVTGKGVDRGSKIRFTYPGNCVLVSRSSDGTKTQNRTEAIGEYSIGKSESTQSINENGLFEDTVSAPEVVNLNILNAYAAVETIYLEQPFKIITFNPRAVTDLKSHAVPRPFEDYEIGDIVYAVVQKGPRFQIGLKNPQPVRVYGFNLELSDNNVENVTRIQTVYSQ